MNRVSRTIASRRSRLHVRLKTTEEFTRRLVEQREMGLNRVFVPFPPSGCQEAISYRIAKSLPDYARWHAGYNVISRHIIEDHGAGTNGSAHADSDARLHHHIASYPSVRFDRDTRGRTMCRFTVMEAEDWKDGKVVGRDVMQRMIPRAYGHVPRYRTVWPNVAK